MAARLVAFLRSLGPSGATANALALLEQRRREDRLVRSMASHITPSGDASPRVA